MSSTVVQPNKAGQILYGEVGTFFMWEKEGEKKEKRNVYSTAALQQSTAEQSGRGGEDSRGVFLSLYSFEVLGA